MHGTVSYEKILFLFSEEKTEEIEMYWKIKQYLHLFKNRIKVELGYNELGGTANVCSL